jgi:hypothetical protein
MVRSVRPLVRSVVAIVPCFTLAACAAISGLDQIQESACAPDGCSDAALASEPSSTIGALDAAGAQGDGATLAPEDAGVSGDAGGGGAIPEDAGGQGDAPTGSTPDGSPFADAAVDDGAPADAPADAPAGDDGPSDAGARDASDAACGSIYFADSFTDNSKGWTLGTDWSIAPECANPPAPQKGNPDPTSDHTGTEGSGVVGAFVCGNNPSGQTLTATYAESPAIDTSGAPTLKLGFWRWLNTDSSTWVASTVDVYNGSAWVNVYTNPSGSGALVTDAAWTYVSIDVTAEKNAAFRVRFGYGVSSTSAYAMSAWNVDDLVVSSAACE